MLGDVVLILGDVVLITVEDEDGIEEDMFDLGMFLVGV
ncbi:hypothetical protein FXW35_05615 [Candidatus Liberibacter asiaticus]|nr:hypothetical protein FXW35_05615 [Candidatus Liberibacter asiaticus]